MTRYLLYALLITLGALFFTAWSCTRIADDRDRLSTNQRSLMARVDLYRTKDSLSVASVERLTLSKSEIEQYCSELVAKCEVLNIKIRRLQSASTTSTETKHNIVTQMRDSLVVRDSMIVGTMRCVDYDDWWLTFRGCERNGIFTAEIESRDTLTTIIYRIPRRFLFFKYGTKAIRQEVISSNPHTNIMYTEYIELKRSN